MPPNGTAGLARCFVRGYRRSPCPPASISVSVSWMIVLVRGGTFICLLVYRCYNPAALEFDRFLGISAISVLYLALNRSVTQKPDGPRVGHIQLETVRSRTFHGREKIPIGCTRERPKFTAFAPGHSAVAT